MTTTDPATAETSRLTYDEIFSICGNERRRRALAYLDGRGGRAELSDVAVHIATMEKGASAAELTRAERKSVYNSLYQTHVPQLEAASVVSYDPAANAVELDAAFEQVESYVGGSPRSPEPRSAHYFGLSLLSGFLLAIDSLHPVDIVPAGSWPTVILALFVLLTLVSARALLGDPLRMVEEVLASGRLDR